MTKATTKANTKAIAQNPETDQGSGAAPATDPKSETATGQAEDTARPADPFDEAVRFVLAKQIEGGYVNDPRDPGGETNFGISKRSYPNVDIRKLTRDDAIAIYRRDFWKKPGCDKLPPALAIALFDCAVNQGTGVAAALLQRALGVAADNIIGPITARAAHAADQREALVDFMSWRLRRYAFTANAGVYMRGWSKRVLYLLRFADQFAEA